MALVARWHGDGLTEGTPVTATTAGPGDAAWNVVTSGAAFIDTAGGTRPPRIRVDQQPSTAAQLIWTIATLGTRTIYAVRMYVEFSALPSVGTPILQAYASANTALRWRLDVTSTGLLRLRDAANTIVATATVPFAVNTEYRIEVMVDGTAAAVAVHQGDHEGTPLIALTGTVGSSLDALRVGNTNTSPTWPRFYLDDLAVADAATPIGPRVRLVAGEWPVPVEWDAGRPQAIELLAGEWDLVAAWSAEATGPAPPIALSGEWLIPTVMTTDTGTPPQAVLIAGLWRPGTVRRMTSGTWQ
jgi:hypothetical protein